MKPLPSTYAATSRAVNLQRKNIFSLLHVSSDKSRKQRCRGGVVGDVEAVGRCTAERLAPLLQIYQNRMTIKH